MGSLGHGDEKVEDGSKAVGEGSRTMMSTLAFARSFQDASAGRIARVEVAVKKASGTQPYICHISVIALDARIYLEARRANSRPSFPSSLHLEETSGLEKEDDGCSKGKSTQFSLHLLETERSLFARDSPCTTSGTVCFSRSTLKSGLIGSS